MHKDKLADAFYSSWAWRKCRAGYISSKRGLCECCMMRGQFVAGTDVHHKIKLTPDNITDGTISLNWDNLELLCDACHDERHGKLRQRADEWGHVDLG